MSWIIREFHFSKSQAEREFNCPLYKRYIRAAKTAKGTKWQRDPQKNLLSKFTLVENPCQRAFLFSNREKAKAFFEKDWAKRKIQKEAAKIKPVSPKRRSASPKRKSSSVGPSRADLVAASWKNFTVRETSLPVNSSVVRSSNQRTQAHQLDAFSKSMKEPTKQDKTNIGLYIRGFK